MGFMENATELVTVAEGVNNITNGLYGSIILLAVFFIGFIVMKKYDTGVAMLVSSFITGIVTTFFFIIGFVGVELFVLPVIAVIVSIFVLIASK